MPVLCKPAVAVPEHVITREQTLALCADLHRDHPRLALALRLIANTGVEKRHLVLPIEQVLHHPGFDERNDRYEEEAKLRVPPVIRQALDNAGVTAGDIDALVYVSCTGFMMPSMTAWLINNLGFRPDVTQLPISQLGCAAGAAAVNRAHDFCAAHPGANVLVVACEFSSLCYQPTDLDVGNLLSNGLFGDGIAAAVLRGAGGHGIELRYQASYLLPNTEHWISFDIGARGPHFRLDLRVPGTMADLAPVIARQARDHGWNASDLDLYVIHAGGPRILDDLARHLRVRPEAFWASRQTLSEYGNIASAVVFDVLRRAFEVGMVRDGTRCLMAGFGPGITAELTLGTCVGEDPPDPVPRAPRPLHAVAEPLRLPHQRRSGRTTAHDRMHAHGRVHARDRRHARGHGAAHGRHAADDHGTCCDSDGHPRRLRRRR
ncbi:type III polyketide synthase [Thermopolyspora sp. NPDC052614]|uniref:type III polyketide synthase n=1 Tax=Thermopolyspora sp. NPDC052614 TaxID=3155682 RepID=UPI003419BC09